MMAFIGGALTALGCVLLVATIMLYWIEVKGLIGRLQEWLKELTS